MQPRNIEVFDGLRVTTDHFDHLQGSIHSAFEDFRGILGLGRVHRGFGVTRANSHTVQVDPGLAFDTQRRRVVSDEPVRLEIPAGGDNAVKFVCVAYDQRADGDVEGHPTRIWDSARVDVRDSPPARTEDAIVLAELHPSEGEEGFTIQTPTREEPPEPEAPKEEAPAPALRAGPPLLWRMGIVTFARQALEAPMMRKLAIAIRGGSDGDARAFAERLGTAEALAGIQLASVATDATAHVVLQVAGVASDHTAPATIWRVDGNVHGHAIVAADGTFSQHGAGMSGLRGPRVQASAATFSADCVLSTATFDAAEANGSEPPLALLAGLQFTLRLVPRNGDGFAVDATLDWKGLASDALARWIEEGTATLTWEAVLGWTGAGVLPAILAGVASVPSAGG